VLVDLLTGHGVCGVAVRHGLSKSVVSRWKAEIPAVELEQVGTKKREQFADAVSGCVTANLESLTAQARAASDPDWIRQQSAKDLAMLHGVMFDKSLRILGATMRFRQPLSQQWTTSERLLALLAQYGEMKAQEFVIHVPRLRGDYLDFYPAAALLHAGYIGTDVKTGPVGGKMVESSLGPNTHDTAIMFSRFALPAGESVQIDNAPPSDSLHKFPCRIFMTAEGYLRLDELEQRRVERNRKRNDYFVSLTVAVLVALISSYLAHYYASKRLLLERAQTAPAAINSPTPVASPVHQQTTSPTIQPPP
jgi:hypothetical protein